MPSFIESAVTFLRFQEGDGECFLTKLHDTSQTSSLGLLEGDNKFYVDLKTTGD